MYCILKIKEKLKKKIKETKEKKLRCLILDLEGNVNHR